MPFRQVVRTGALALALCLAASTAGALQVQQDIVYAQTSPAERLDLYRPAAPGLHPLVIFVHGGGWQHGAKAGGRRLAAPINAAGYVFASLDYRLYPEATVQDEATDIARAAEFLLAHAENFGIDARHFALLGHSAGGHLITLVAIDPRFARVAGLDLTRLAAVIPLDGVFDVAADVGRNPNSPLRPLFGNDAAAWRQLSPIALLDGMTIRPRFCLLHETTQQRFIRQAQGFAKALHDHGVPMAESEFPGLSHMALLQLFDDPQAPVGPAVVACLANALATR